MVSCVTCILLIFFSLLSLFFSVTACMIFITKIYILMLIFDEDVFSYQGYTRGQGLTLHLCTNECVICSAVITIEK